MNGARPLIDAMQKLRAEISRPDVHLRRVVAPLRRQYFARAFATKGASTGKPWDDLEPRYLQQQLAIGDDTRPLRANQPRLEPSFQRGPDHVFRLFGAVLEIGSSVPYASHVALGGTNPLTGERFPGRDPRPLGASAMRDLSSQLQKSITREALQ